MIAPLPVRFLKLWVSGASMKYCMFILLILSRVAYAHDCKHRIIFLPQTHASIMGDSLHVTPNLFDATSQSQFKIATYLKQHKDLPVFSEQVSSETTMKTVSPAFLAVTKTIRAMFPIGPGLTASHFCLRLAEQLRRAKW